MADSVLTTRVAIVGPGRAARAFARSWLRAGGTLQEVVARDLAGARRAVNVIGAGQPRAWDTGPWQSDLLVLGVPDDAIAATAGELARHVRCRFAFHLSGARAAADLAPLASTGACVGSLHPVRPFSGADDEGWEGALITIEGDDAAVRLGERMVAALGARSHRIDSSRKALYHAGATLAAGGSLALVSLATRAWTSIGISEEDARAALADLASRAVASARRRSFEEAFTGPVARRDLQTVRVHRSAFAALPDALAIYIALARETLSATPGRGKEAEILAVLEGRDR